MALYDLKLNKKITEDFHFDANQPHMRTIIESIQAEREDLVAPIPDVPPNWLRFPKQVRHFLAYGQQEYMCTHLLSISQAIFSVRNCHTDIFLVIRIETILQGSLVSLSEPYLKPNSDTKTGLKAQKSARSYSARSVNECRRYAAQILANYRCTFRLGKFRMPFAWAARPLFRPSGELDTSTELTTIFRQEVHRNSDEDLLKVLNDYRKYVFL